MHRSRMGAVFPRGRLGCPIKCLRSVDPGEPRGVPFLKLAGCPALPEELSRLTLQADPLLPDNHFFRGPPHIIGRGKHGHPLEGTYLRH